MAMSNKTLGIVTNKIQIIINRATTDGLCLKMVLASYFSDLK